MFEDEQLQGGAKITEKEQGADQIDPEVKLSSGGPTISSIQSTNATGSKKFNLVITDQRNG